LRKIRPSCILQKMYCTCFIFNKISFSSFSCWYMLERMDERTIFVDEFQDAASKDGDWLIIGKFTESAEWSNRNYSAIYDCRMIVWFQLSISSDGRGKHMYMFLSLTTIAICMRSVQVQQVVWIRKIFVGIIAWQQLILATCFPRYYIVMRAERPMLLRFLNVGF
jgi:hypothetical protein